MNSNSNIATKDELISEAVKRMQSLGISEQIINDFKKNGELTVGMENGCAYALSDAHRAYIRKLEKRWKCKVMAAIGGKGMFGPCIYFIIFCSDKRLWPSDHDILSQRCLFAHVYNLAISQISDVGYVEVAQLPGGMLKVIRQGVTFS